MCKTYTLADQLEKAFQNARSKITMPGLNNLRQLYIQLVEDHTALSESQQNELSQAQRQLDDPLQAPLRYLENRARQLAPAQSKLSTEGGTNPQLLEKACGVCRAALEGTTSKTKERVAAIEKALEMVRQTLKQPGLTSTLEAINFIRDWQEVLEETTFTSKRLSPLLDKICFWPRYKNPQTEIDELRAVAYALEEMAGALSARAFYLIFPLWQESVNTANEHYSDALGRLKTVSNTPLENLFASILKRGEDYCQSGKALIEYEKTLLEFVAGTRKA